MQKIPIALLFLSGGGGGEILALCQILCLLKLDQTICVIKT